MKIQLFIPLLISWAVIAGNICSRYIYNPQGLNQNVVDILGCNESAAGYGNLKLNVLHSGSISELQILAGVNDICEHPKLVRSSNFDLHFYNRILVGLTLDGEKILDVEKGKIAYFQKTSLILLIAFLFNLFVGSVYLAMKLSKQEKNQR